MLMSRPMYWDSKTGEKKYINMSKEIDKETIRTICSVIVVILQTLILIHIYGVI